MLLFNSSDYIKATFLNKLLLLLLSLLSFLLIKKKKSQIISFSKETHVLRAKSSGGKSRTHDH